MSTMVWGRRAKAARKKTDVLSAEAEVRMSALDTRLARLARATERAEEAAVAFIQEHENVMVLAAKARQERR